MSYTDYYLEIVRASKNRKLVFFVGAGISRVSGYPGWRELIVSFHKELYGTTPRELSNEECLRIAQVFYDSRGKESYDKVLERVFGAPHEPNPIHWKMLALNPVHFITTNYDALIERACVRRGRNFEVISSDTDVANVDSPGYILKIHGDFRDGYDGDSIVLRESDYLNYENNYPLSINLVKTILSTHTVVFIGYGLGDHNVNYILNWVKQLQGEEFSAPFFIRTECCKLSDHDMTYYTKKGLRIIESARLVDTADHIERYAKALDGILGFKENLHLTNDHEIINYVWHKITPLRRLERIRKKDLSILFDEDYYFESSGAVYRLQNIIPPYLERFFVLQRSGIDNIEDEDVRGKFNDIQVFFDKNGIIGMADRTFEVSPSKVNDPVFHGKYEDIEAFCNNCWDDPERKYRKAYYLAYLGKWKEAYNLYSEVISETVQSDPLIYYLSQLNRYWLYLSIRGYSLRFMRVVPGLLTEEFYERIQREMRNFNVNHLFSEMPYELREKYPFLESLSDNQFLYEDTVKLFEQMTKVQEHMKKGSYSVGWSTELDLQFTTDDTLAFLYDNCMWSSSFDLIKQYTRNSFLLQLEKAYYDMTRDIDEFAGFLEEVSFSLNYHDFIKITTSFRIEDVRFIEKSYGPHFLIFNEQSRIEAYLIRLAEVFEKSLRDTEGNPIFHDLVIGQLKLGCYLTRYLKLSESAFDTMLRLILYKVPEREASLWNYCLQRMAQGSGLYESSVRFIEKYVIEQLESEHVEAFNGTLADYGHLIKHFKRDYISEDLSNYALKVTERDRIVAITSLFGLLSPEAQKHVLDTRKDHIGSIPELLLADEMGLVKDLSNYQGMITEYLVAYMERKSRDRERGITFIDLSGGVNVIRLAISFFLGKLHDPIMKQFMGAIDEYDMFVEPEFFDYEEKFNPVWLKKYTSGLLQEIAKNEHMRPQLIEALKEKVKNTNEKQYARILLDYFL